VALASRATPTKRIAVARAVAASSARRTSPIAAAASSGAS
jgi:hypothetical protein